jgi:hypothetical protein
VKRKELEKEIGTLSNPSKMPAFAWGISAKKCITGAKLAKVKGTICNKCYALKGHYAFKNVFDAHELRRKAIEKNEWVDYMAELITQKYKNLDKSRHFHRWFDSGDLQSFSHLMKIFEVCERTPHIKYWLATREYQFIKDIKEGALMKITIEIEWRKKDEPEPIKEVEWVARQALIKAGYDVGHVFVQGDYLEDKPKIPFTNGERYPHEEIAK